MKTLDAHGDDYRNAQLTILLEASLEDNANVKPVVILTAAVCFISPKSSYLMICKKKK